nr:DUF305 domain-containing protein [Streptomyces zingiberis]
MAGRVRPPALALTAAVAVLALTACESEDSGASAAEGSRPSVVAPGRPGEEARTLSPEEARKQGAREAEPNAADIRFVRMMIVHHRQALTLSALAEERAGSRGVRKLAERITAAQKPEIGAMEGWLDRHDLPREEKSGGQGDHGEHGEHGEAGEAGEHTEHGGDHAGMPGMATEAQIKQLTAARGGAFDELFVKLMTTHHQGAVTMATEVLGAGADVTVEEMATEMGAQQSAEIRRMRDL